MNKHDGIKINQKADLRQAMVEMSEKTLTLLIVVGEYDKVVGVITDGDIRRFLLSHGELSALVEECMTIKFSFVSKEYEREEVIKLLDCKIRSIPVLDSEGHLIDIVNSQLDYNKSQQVSRARAPARISLAGGGTDFTKYFMDQGGAGLSCTIAKYSHAVLRKRTDKKIKIYSHDFRQNVEINCIDDIKYDGNLDLIKAGIKLLKPDYGFDLEIGCDFPPASGLGGSASLLASVIGCLNEFRENKLDRYAIAEYAFEAERIELDIAGGWQDQYSTVFGGFNYLEFDRQHNVVMPLRLESSHIRELEENFILCHTKTAHLGKTIQKDNHKKSNSEKKYKDSSERLKEITKEMKRNLLRNKYDKFAILMDETWVIKKDRDPRVTNIELEKIYTTALNAGAIGGRLLGTGGGGYFLFYSPPFYRYSVIEALENIGLKPEGVSIDQKGLSSWRV
jgi:D-glycero-alpha-D-manno-heptose-7-phosphate kinase